MRRPAEPPTASEILLDVPLQVRSVERLSPRELARFRRACSLLTAGGGAHSLVLEDLTLRGLGVYEALLAQCWAVRFARPEEMVRLAEAAVEVARDFDPQEYGAERVADLQARAWGELANAYRAADRLRSAEKTFGEAYFLLNRGTDDPYLRMRLLDLEASLLGTWREFPLALHRLTSLANIYQDLGEPHLAGRAMIVRALYTFYGGETEEAIGLNEEGLRLIDRTRDQALFMVALHNHLLFLVDLGRYRQAKRALFENRRHLFYKDHVNALKLRGIEGQISYGMGELLSAEIAFREVKEGAANAGMSFYCALVSLELSMVLVSQNRADEAELEVIAAREIFLSVEVYREYLGALIYLEQCFQQRDVTAEIIEETITFLRRKELQIRPRHLR